LSAEQRRLPKIYLEHNTPKPNAVDTRHPVDDPNVLLVHVTHYNRLMWDNGGTPTMVIEHSVAIDPSIRYSGHLQRGITVVNGMQKRPRIAGYDLFLQAQQMLPLDAVGMETEAIGGLGDVPYRELHHLVAGYRFLFSPIRYTSLPLAVIEAMTIGMPVVALATTELPTVIESGKTGYVSCDIDQLVNYMRYLLVDREEAYRLGENARTVALTRFGLDRFIKDWNHAFELAAQNTRTY
jgi:glycosyltransferase involved in cell wall biosynthesis